VKKNVLLFWGLICFSPLLTGAQGNIDQLILNRKYKKALTEIEIQKQKHPNEDLYLKEGIIYRELQEYQQAVASFKYGLQYDSVNITLWEETADCLALLGNHRDAVVCYKKAVQLDSTNLVLSGKLGHVYISLKNYQKAYETFSSIYNRDSTNVFRNKQLAYCAFRISKRDEAIKLYEKVIDANPGDYISYINLVKCFDQRKQGMQRMLVVELGLKEFPDGAELYYERAMYRYRTKQYQWAMTDFERYLKLEKQPKYETLMNYGIATYFAGFEEKALELFNDLCVQRPNDPLVLYYQSLCYKKIKDYEQATQLMQMAIESSTPGYVPEMYHHLGQLWGQQRKFNESIKALKKAYELNPEKTEVLFEIATTYEEFNSNKTLALNYYNIYLKAAAESGKNISYALDRIKIIKEDLFMGE